MTEEKKLWFSIRRFGMCPCCWQGWTVLLLFIALIATATWYVPQSYYTVWVATLSATLVAICIGKGGRSRSRNGN